MLTEQILTQCNGCMACYNICPVECIQMEINQEGFWYPKIESEKCIKCNRCSNICPLNMKKSNNEVRVAYAAMHKNLQVRLGSSSGGVFPALAKSILKNKGVVFGPDFDDRWNLHHVAIHNLEDLHKLCGSKYVQSKIGDSYQEVKKYLEEGKRVLFTGTPCQVAGLKQYLRKDYENLICQDIACHGVASPFVLKKYMEFRQKKVRTNVRRMFFRHKKYGWKTYSLLFEYSNNKEYVFHPYFLCLKNILRTLVRTFF